jgi:hypothetical protein
MLHINQRANENKHSSLSAGSADVKKEWNLYLSPLVCLAQRGGIKRAEIHFTLVQNRRNTQNDS